MSDVGRSNEPAVILVVDDDVSMRNLLRDALTHLGYGVVEAENGAQALSQFETAGPHLVLLDVIMPDMSGFDVCLAIRQMRGGQHVPIVMLTGVDEMSAISRAYEVGATDFVTKGTSWLILSERVRYILRASSAAEQLRMSEARLAKAQQIAHLGSWEYDVDRDEFYCSAQTREICGLDRQSPVVSYQDLLQCVHPEDRDHVHQSVQRVIQERISHQMDHRIILPDGDQRVVFHHLDGLADQDGPTRRIAGTIQDITQRKRAELLEADRNQALEMILRNEPVKNILLHFVHLLERQRPQALASMSMVKGSQLVVGVGPGLPEAFAHAMDGIDIDPSNGSSAAAVCYKDAVAAGNIEESPYWVAHRALASEHQIRSAVAVPIVSGEGGILGTVDLYYRQVQGNDQSDLDLLNMVSKLAAIVIEKRGLSERLVYQSHHDALTALPNRLLLMDRLEHAIAWSDRYKKKVAVISCDLDRFKQINESLGHHIGDQLLQQVTERFKECTRVSDTLARVGGDDFTVVLNGIEHARGVSGPAARLIEALREPFRIDQRDLYITGSIGISVYPDDGPDAHTLMKHADTAMYFAKSQGGNRYQYFDMEMNAAVIERLELEHGLRKALERGELEIYYQPQYVLGSKRLVGAEALLRWNHPDKGRVPPSKFIPIAEETGLIIPIGNWTLREACLKNAAWQQAGYAPFNMAVNISAVQLRDPEFVNTVAVILEETGLSGKWLQLDVTESVVMRDFDLVTNRLTELRELGVTIAIDDFGTGYSTMAYLQWLPVDCLKIDSSFVQEIESTKEGSIRTRNLIKAFVGLAESFGLQLLAEGVESQEQFDFLRQVGCTGGQGYLLDVPMSAQELEALCEDFMKSIGGTDEIE